MTVRVIPDVIGNMITHVLTPDASVQEAVDLMTEKSIGVVMIIDPATKNLCGIFSERDLVTRVVGQGKNPGKTLLREVMTNEVVTIKPDTSAHEALDLMRNHHCRHLPVVSGKRAIGMVSIRDLYSAVNKSLKKDLVEREKFIFSGGY